MDKKTKLMVGFLLLLIVAAVFVAAGSSEQKAEVRYNYDIKIIDSFQSDGFTYKADAGKQFAVVTWTIANDSYSPGFSTNDMMFAPELVVNGISYSTCFETMMYPGYMLGTITEGHRATFPFLYEVPAGTMPWAIQVKIDYIWTFDPPKMEMDPTL